MQYLDSSSPRLISDTHNSRLTTIRIPVFRKGADRQDAL